MNTYPFTRLIHGYSSRTLVVGALAAAVLAPFGAPIAVYLVSSALLWLPTVFFIGDIAIRLPLPSASFYTVLMYVLVALAVALTLFFLRELHERWRSGEVSKRVFGYSGIVCIALIAIAFVSYVYIPLA